MGEPPVIFLMGPTACGKTALSLSLARALNAEIVSVDSALVYRGMDIGTAKPTLQERSSVPHHLIDICDPWDSYSAARFCSDAHRAIEAIRSRGKPVLLTGGTMLYFKALEEGLAILPDADAKIRQALMAEAETVGWPAMHAQLQAIDPTAARRIHRNDPQRLQRALEVYRITGTPMSELQSDTRSLLDSPPLKVALVPSQRSWLHRRIEKRFRAMIGQGFVDEMQRLRQHPLIHAQLPAMRSVGYRQAWEQLDALEVHGCASEDALPDGPWIDRAIAATRQLAKRQLTWLRGMTGVIDIACDRLSPDMQVARVSEAIRIYSADSTGSTS
jgi:tRNA dimethylallyltransferase